MQSTIRVLVFRTKRGYLVRSFDFTSNILEQYSGKNSLKHAIASADKYNWLNKKDFVKENKGGDNETD